MSALVAAPWLAVLVPLVLAALVGLFGRYAKSLTPWIVMVGPLMVLAIGIGALMTIPAGGAAAAEPWTSALASAGSSVWFGVGTLTHHRGLGARHAGGDDAAGGGYRRPDGDGVLDRLHGRGPGTRALLRASLGVHGRR